MVDVWLFGDWQPFIKIKWMFNVLWELGIKENQKGEFDHISTEDNKSSQKIDK